MRRARGGLRAHRGLARSYQIIPLFPLDTILRNVVLALLGLSGLRWNPLVDLARQRDFAARAREALALVGLTHVADRPLTETSYGERRRVEIALAMAPNTKVLLLGQPLSGPSIDQPRDVPQFL